MTKLLPTALAAALLLPALPVEASYYQPGGTRQESCYKTVYREEYVPGTQSSPGYVKRYTERIRVHCEIDRNEPHVHPAPTANTDDNSCIEGSILGGIAGAAGGAALSRGDGRWIGIPLGIVGGSLIGCQLDGG